MLPVGGPEGSPIAVAGTSTSGALPVVGVEGGTVLTTQSSQAPYLTAFVRAQAVSTDVGDGYISDTLAGGSLMAFAVVDGDPSDATAEAFIDTGAVRINIPRDADGNWQMFELPKPSFPWGLPPVTITARAGSAPITLSLVGVVPD